MDIRTASAMRAVLRAARLRTREVSLFAHKLYAKLRDKGKLLRGVATKMCGSWLQNSWNRVDRVGEVAGNFVRTVGEDPVMVIRG